jgi:hypothetical protein
MKLDFFINIFHFTSTQISHMYIGYCKTEGLWQCVLKYRSGFQIKLTFMCLFHINNVQSYDG